MSMQNIKPVPRGLYPQPFNAILSPEGRFYPAGPWKHYQVAYELTGEDWDNLVKTGWLRIFQGTVYFVSGFREMTQAQIDAIADYAQFKEMSILDAFDVVYRADVARFFGLE
jgi:hypothetical protein